VSSLLHEAVVSCMWICLLFQCLRQVPYPQRNKTFPTATVAFTDVDKHPETDRLLGRLFSAYWNTTKDNLRALRAGIATGSGLDGRGVGVRDPVGPTSSRPAPGSTQPLIQWSLWILSLRVKRPECEANHLQTSAEVKKMWIYTSTPIRLHGVVLN
jgi:hypothetical protein